MAVETFGGLAFKPLDRNRLSALYCICNETSSVDLDRLSLSRVQEEPPSLRLEQEGGQGSPAFFIRPSHILFVRTEGLFVEPIRVRAGAAGSRQGCRKSLLASARGERAVESSPGFFYTPRA